MDGSDTIEITVLESLSEIGAGDWDTCACPEAAAGRPVDPFTTHRFLGALEASGSVGKGTGWQPRHLVARAEGRVIGVMPLYAKSHSQGEYVFDHNWAHAYERAGGSYYPKLQSSVPFTPATGRRLLAVPGHEDTARAALLQAAVQLAGENGVSSLHITFCTSAEYEFGGRIGLMQRTGQQFHWQNQDYDSFDDFLGGLSSRKRKNIRKERALAQSAGCEIVELSGDALLPEHWDAFWNFYQDTGARKWGTPYLTRQFFDLLQDTMRDDVILYLAHAGGQWIAGALNFIGRDCLYGRYWGCLADVPALHFEMCYYRAIDYSIAHKLARVEAGAQGPHKLARGYLPVEVYSLHWVADPGFRDAIAQYLEAEREAVGEEIEVLTGYGPFRKSQGEE